VAAGDQRWTAARWDGEAAVAPTRSRAVGRTGDVGLSVIEKEGRWRRGATEVERVKTTKKKTHATKKMGSHNRVTHVDKVARTFYDSTGSLYHILPPFFFYCR
jgi:Zn-dependent alcohol dehydrogenase